MIQAGDPTGTSCGLLLLLSVYRSEPNFSASCGLVQDYGMQLLAALSACDMQALARVERAYMAANLRMRLIAPCITLVLEFSAWPMQVPIQTEAR